MRIGYAGAPGAFAWLAVKRASPEAKAVALGSFAAVAEAVASGAVDAGMLPIENSIAGPVPGNRELVKRHGLAVRRTFELPVELHLLALPRVTLDELRRVTSHPMALSQCTGSIAALGLEAVAAENTAEAARDLADRASAVLASEEAAALYGLSIVRRNLQDRADNVTTFWMVTPTGIEPVFQP